MVHGSKSAIRTTCRKLSEELAEHPITFVPTPLVDKDSKVLALGSCFALRVKEYLLANSYRVLNEGDLRPQIINGRREFDPRIYYNTFTIRYEFERASGQFVQDDDDIWEPHHTLSRVYQDPYRRMLASLDRDDLWQRIREVDAQMVRHIREANLVIITLGLTEVFFQQHNGRAICAAPGYAGGGGIGCEFRATEYQENYDNIDTVIRILKAVNPQAHLVLTVSPVPLGSTFAGVDHAIANTESKCTLRAVAGALVRRYAHVHYFHSYELVMHASRHDVFLDDGRHVRPEYVAGVMQEFERAFVRPAATTAAAIGPHFGQVISPSHCRDQAQA
jgi:hypothetical protein